MIKTLNFLYLLHLLLRVENNRRKKDAVVWLRLEHCDLKCLLHAQLPQELIIHLDMLGFTSLDDGFEFLLNLRR